MAFYVALNLEQYAFGEGLVEDLVPPLGPLVLGVALHAHVSGQPFRLRPLRQALQHVQAKGAAVWIADTDRVAAAWKSVGGERR